MNYAVRLQKAAERMLDRVDRPTSARFLRRLDELAADPFDPRISKSLASAQDKRSSRVGSWRIIYSVNTSDRSITVFFIEPRGQVYRRL